MEVIYLGLWDDFVCLAGECPSTCCAGWNIVVDEKARLRIQQLSLACELGGVILDHIYCKEGEYRFENRPDGRCSVLREDGLCHIWHDLGEAFLCNTCRKYPQLMDISSADCTGTAGMSGRMRMSMAASCPVVAEYLWNGNAEWFYVRDESGDVEKQEDILSEDAGKRIHRKRRYRIDEWMRTKKDWDWYQELGEKISQKQKNRPVKIGLEQCQSMWDLMEGCLDLLLQSREMPYLKGSFDYFESEDISTALLAADVERFDRVWKQGFYRFMACYIPYRLFGLSFSASGIKENECSGQILGELGMMYIISFSRFHTLEHFSVEQMIEGIHWVYRFTAHGRERQQRITRWFVQNLEAFLSLFGL